MYCRYFSARQQGEQTFYWRVKRQQQFWHLNKMTHWGNCPLSPSATCPPEDLWFMTMYSRGSRKDGFFFSHSFFFSGQSVMPCQWVACAGPDGESKLLKGSDCSTDLLQALQCEEVVLNHNELNWTRNGIDFSFSALPIAHSNSALNPLPMPSSRIAQCSRMETFYFCPIISMYLFLNRVKNKAL